MIEDQQRSLRREHGDAQVGIFRNTLPPDPGGVNHHPGVQSAGLVKLAVVYLDAADVIAPAQQACYFAAGRICAPCSRASSILAAVRRNGSMVPSGTCTAPSSVGLTAGSRRSASCGESGVASMPAC